MAADVEGFIRDRKLGSATVMGHSMGAKAAMVLALRKPQLVDRFIAVDNCPIGTPLSEDFEQYVKAMLDIQEQKVKSRAEADSILAKYEPNISIRQFLLTNLVKSKTDGGMTFRVPVDTLGNALPALGAFLIRQTRTLHITSQRSSSEAHKVGISLRESSKLWNTSSQTTSLRASMLDIGCKLKTQRRSWNLCMAANP